MKPMVETPFTQIEESPYLLFKDSGFRNIWRAYVHFVVLLKYILNLFDKIRCIILSFNYCV